MLQTHLLDAEESSRKPQGDIAVTLDVNCSCKSGYSGLLEALREQELSLSCCLSQEFLRPSHAAACTLTLLCKSRNERKQ